LSRIIASNIALTEQQKRAPAAAGAPQNPLGKVSGLAGDGFGELRGAWSAAMLEESAGGEKLGVEKSGTGGAAD